MMVQVAMPTSAVPAEGTADAKIAIIGEAPGASEVQHGRPFAGHSGHLLDSWLAQVGITRRTCYIDNVMQVRPKNNNFAKEFYTDKQPTQALLAGHARINAVLQELRPNITIAVGNEALKALTGKSSITKWRGSVLKMNFGKVVPMIHPASVLRNYTQSGLCLFDLARAKRESTTAEYAKPFHSEGIRVVKTLEQALHLLEAACDAEYVAIDLETVMYTQSITHFGFCCAHDWAASIPLVDAGGGHMYNEQQEVLLWSAISRLCSSKAKKIVQNAIFDLPVLAANGVLCENLWLDTLVAQHLCYPELPKGLHVIASIYTDVPYYYDLKDTGWENYGRYNALDCLVTYRAAMNLQEELESIGSARCYFSIVHPALLEAITMQERGLRCDIAWRDVERTRLQARAVTLQAAVDRLAGKPLNVASSKQMQSYFYDELGLPVQTKRSTSKPTMDEAAIFALARKHPLPIWNEVLKLRHVNTLISLYYAGDLDPDMRIRSSLNVAGTVSGRWSSSKTSRNTGLNLQNIAMADRRMVVPDEGKLLLQADEAQADARVVAWDSGDEALLSAFRSGADVHRVVAAKVFSIPPAAVSTDQRFAAKTVEHASNYGTGPRTFASAVEKNTLGRQLRAAARDESVKVDTSLRPLSIAEAKAQQSAYFAQFFRIPLWHMRIHDKVRKSKTLTTPLGRVRYFFDRINDATLREAVNWIPQSTVADVINLVLSRAACAMPDGADVLMQCHDSVLIQCWPKDLEQVKRVLHNASQIVLFDDLVIPLSYEFGTNWRDLA